MQAHPYFDLWLHDDSELENLLLAQVVERTTLHEWPLSCVQRLHLSDGRTWIYKVQFNEGVETQFYAAARSPVLVGHRPIGTHRDTVALLLEAVDAPLLAQSQPDWETALAHANRLEAAIAQIQGDLPVYWDLGSAERWQAFARRVCAQLDGLLAEGCFQQVRPAGLRALRSWASSADVLAAAARSALAHADLSNTNVFVTPDGYRIIDWQYPRRLAAGFDRANLLDSLGFDPLRAVEPAVVGTLWFVRLAWFVECQLRLFPQGDYGQDVSRWIDRIESLR